MERCIATYQLLFRGSPFFSPTYISYYWPENLCTEDVCEKVWAYIEENAEEFLNSTKDYSDDFEASQFIIENTVNTLMFEGKISIK
jgi:hypothetical protein